MCNVVWGTMLLTVTVIDIFCFKHKTLFYCQLHLAHTFYLTAD